MIRIRCLFTLLACCACLAAPPEPACAAVPRAGESLAPLVEAEELQLSALTADNDCAALRLKYPAFGRPNLDAGILVFAERLFAAAVEDSKRDCAERGRSPDEPKWEWSGELSETHVTPGALSLEFAVLSDTGGAHPAHAVHTLIVSAVGKGLGYGDLFGKSKGLWKFLSDYAFASLRQQMKKNGCWDAATVREGLSPKVESFSSFVVTPQGLALIFPEYQVASYACGPQRVEVPLKALKQFAPAPGIWKGAEAGRQKTGSDRALRKD